MPARILVVDDESDLELLILQKFRQRIKSGELSFEFALNGKEALEKVQNGGNFDALMTDINMPEMDGLTLLSKLRELGGHMKAIVVSAYGDMVNIRTAMNRGAFDFIVKPIDFKDLETTIEKTIREAELIRQGAAAKENLEKAVLEKEIALIEKEKAEEAKRFEQQFLANMSHEIRTPMNAVMGMTNLVLKTNLDERQLKYIQAIRVSSENLLSIINDILDISKIEAGKIEFESIPFGISEVFANVHSVLHFKAEEKSLKLDLHFDEQIPAVLLGDPARLNQILINLVGNAIKFTEQGGVKVHCKLQGRENEKALLEFSVTDTGIGIAADKIDKVFESFTQASAETNRKFGGTGLGLTISRQLVEMQGGKIFATSELGKGTTFTFTLPCPIAAGEQPAAAPAAPEQPQLDRIRKARILLVEDNEFNRIVAVDTLNEYLGEIKVEMAGDGKEAIDKLLGAEFDIVLMDIQMPGMDGYDATKHIRTQLQAPLKNIPILAMTANATREEIEKCRECGMNGHIAKPFVPEDLFQKMSDLLEASGK